LKSGRVTYVWEEPLGTPKGILFLAHGCQHSALDFWPSNPKCEECVGLPEEHKIVKKALESKYTVLAISSHSQGHGGCWAARHDNNRVLKVLKKIKSEDTYKRLPVFALGVSSGGSFVAQLPEVLQQIAAVFVMVGHSDISFVSKKVQYPPSQWIHMPRDRILAEQINETVHGLRKAGFRADEIQVDAIPLSPTYFSDRIEKISPHLSTQIYDILKKNNFLKLDDTLAMDPRFSNWRRLLEPLMAEISPDTLRINQSPISEEMNVAWAHHEITADHILKTISFMDKISDNWLDNSHANEH
jgi:hypothetical protein